jgi:hypothetical protein
LRKALAFRAAARLALGDLSDIGDPDVATANAVLSAIAYTDALTATSIQMVNQQDHAAAVKLLRAALGKALPASQERRLSRLLGRKDEASYGARAGQRSDAVHLLAELEEFAVWAGGMLAAAGVKITADDAGAPPRSAPALAKDHC